MKFIFYILLLALVFSCILSTMTKSKTQTQTSTQTATSAQAKAQTHTNTQFKSKAQSKSKMLAQSKTSAKTATSTSSKSKVSIKLKSEAKLTTLSKKQMEELAKLRAAEAAVIASASNNNNENKYNDLPTKQQLENLSEDDKAELIKRTLAEDAKKVPIKNVQILEINGKDILWKGWIKYFHYSNDQNQEKPDHFYENPNYYTEKVLFSKKADKSIDGNYKYIQSKEHFWGKLLASGNFNILGSRREEDNTMANNVENLNLDLIRYVHPSDNANGAIKDLGFFNEGYCISIETTVPNNKKDVNYNPRTQAGDLEDWIICTDLEKEKKKLMSYLITLKIRRQKDIDDDGLDEKLHYTSIAELMKIESFRPRIEKYRGRGASDDDGYWILLQDWSVCSLKCGGGEMVQQWMCVPPKNQGKPCIGRAIRSKPCNIGPCPDTLSKSGISIKNDKSHVTLKPIFKAMPYSKRPQQFVKCHIKENDVLYLTKEYDPEHKRDDKIPGRVVMNTQTISVYKDDGYSNLLFSFNLQNTTFSKHSKEHCCFTLTSLNRQFTLCGFNNNCGTPENPIWVAKWGFDFEYFQQKCYRELHEVKALLRPGKQSTGPGDQGIPLSQQQKDIVEGRRAIIEKKIHDNTEQKMDDKVDATQKVALVALRREINLEDLIKNEEIQKGKGETQLLIEQMKQEKKKKQLLEQALTTRESNYGNLRTAKDTQKKIDNIKAEAKVDITFKRGVLKKKIEEIRNKFRRKHRQIKQQIQMIRAEMAKEIMVSNKRGNSDLCREGRNDTGKIKEYCDKSYSTDYVKNLGCKDPQNFCYSCCDAEFGNMFISERDDCQTMCDDLDKEELNKGDWVWTAGDSSTKDGQPGLKIDGDTKVTPSSSHR